MRYILDSSVALKWVLAEPDSPIAGRLRVDTQQAIHTVHAPDVFQVEIAHALTRAERQGRIVVGMASLLWADIMTSPPQLKPIGTLIPRALEISSSLRFGLYDCLYVALAERENCELITADNKLVQYLQPIFPFITSLASLP